MLTREMIFTRGLIDLKFEVDFSDEDSLIVENYMKETNLNISEVARQAILEMIFQDDADLAAYEKAIEEYRKDPKTYTLEELKVNLGIA